MSVSRHLKGSWRNGRRKPRGGSRVVPGPRRLVLRWMRNGKLGALLLLLGSVAAIFFVLTSPAFVVQSVEVVNSHLQMPEQVVQLSGIRGRSIWLVEPDEVVERLKQSSYIEAAAVMLVLPDRATIAVRERVPAIRWSAGGVQYLVDREGVVLGPAEQSDAESLVVMDTSHPGLQPGDKIDPDALELAQALSVRLPQELALEPKRIEWDIGYGISVITQRDQQIAFGRKSDRKVSLDVKIATLRKLLADGTQFSFLDLRPTLPYYR